MNFIKTKKVIDDSQFNLVLGLMVGFISGVSGSILGVVLFLYFGNGIGAL